MPISLSHDLSLALAARLETITIANGFQTDIGLTVFRGKGRIDEGDVPCCVIYEAGDKKDGDSQAASLAGGPTRMKLSDVHLMQRYFIEGHAPCDPDHPNDAAHAIIADLKRALFDGDRSFGDRVRRLFYHGRAIGRREDGARIVNASIVVDAEIVENLASP
jgi:hypothetical protein